MLETVLTAVSVVAVLTLLLASLLIFANSRLRVVEDPRLETVEDMLPHANCGSCGFPSCHMFAEALVANQALPGKCSVSSPQDRDVIATFLQVDVGEQVKRVARLACAGGDNVATRQANYQGVATCNAAAQVSGGGKSCMWGCLGLGDCAAKCTFGAITMDAHGLPKVDEAKCTACGDCVVECPKGLFSLESTEQHLWVACKNLEQGEHVQQGCQVGCTACGRCAADAPNQIKMHHNLPNVFANNTSDGAGRNAIERCPTGAIIWFGDAGPVKGAAAVAPIRNTSLPTAFS